MTRMVVIALAAMVSGCATMNAGAYIAPQADFRAYHTYAWTPADPLPTGDPRLDDNGIFLDHFEGAIDRNLAQRGYEQLLDGSADLLLHYHATVRQRVDVSAVERNARDCVGRECQPTATDYDEALLLLDVVDARTQKLVWRGWAQTPLNGIVENQDRLQKSVDEAVTRMLKTLPVR